MKTRIISGIVMGAIVAAVLVVGYLWAPIVISIAVGLLAAVAMYEIIHNAAGIKNNDIINAIRFTPTQPELDMVKHELLSMKQRLVQEFSQKHCL